MIQTQSNYAASKNLDTFIFATRKTKIQKLGADNHTHFDIVLISQLTLKLPCTLPMSKYQTKIDMLVPSLISELLIKCHRNVQLKCVKLIKLH